MIACSGRNHKGGLAETFGNIMLDLKIPLFVDKVNLVYRNKCWHIYAVPLYGINQVILCCPTPHKYICIHHLTFRQNRPDFLNIKVQRTDSMKTHSPMGSLFDSDIRFRDIDPYTSIIELF